MAHDKKKPLSPAPEQAHGDHAQMAALLHELDETMRMERLQLFWKENRAWLIGALLLAFVMTAGRTSYMNYKEQRLAKQSEQFWSVSALIEKSNADSLKAADVLLAELIKDGSEGYRLAAKFEQARVLQNTMRAQGAAELYAQVADDGSLPAVYRQLAALYQGQALMTFDDAKAVAVLTPLTVEGGAFRGVALEILAYNAENKRDTAAAISFYSKIIADKRVPAGVSERAAARLAYLQRGDVVSSPALTSAIPVVPSATAPLVGSAK